MAFIARSANCAGFVYFFAALGLSQDPPPRNAALELSGSVRARVENWDWFGTPQTVSRYTYFAGLLRLNLHESWQHVTWVADAGFPLFLNLPGNAIAPEPGGPLGYGGDYFAANRAQNVTAAALRQGFLMIRGENWRARFGRFEFADGAEATPADPALAALKRERVNQRLIGTFNYALRSLDGAEFSWSRGPSTVSAMAARLVEGSFLLRAGTELDAELAYGSWTRNLPSRLSPAEVRVFVVYYQDRRGTMKADNRPMAQLEVDRRPIRLATPGFHYIRTWNKTGGAVDVVVWAAGQIGAWGRQRHRAGEVAIEAGYQFSSAWHPWLRAGYLHSSGDHDPADGLHGTFFQLLSSPRAYARYPFYVLMNTNDVFFQAKAAPWRALALRSEVHAVRLSSAADGWYDGGGAFEAPTFGYLGRPSGGKKGIGTALDLSAEYTIAPTTSISVYAGAGRGSAVPAAIFPSPGTNGWTHVISLELVQRF